MPKAGESVEMHFADPDELRFKRQPGEAEPERAMWFGVLEQAFRDAVSEDTRKHPAFWRGDALAWFKSDSRAVGSLRWVVHSTGIDTTVAAIRERVAKGGKIGRARRQYRTS